MCDQNTHKPPSSKQHFQRFTPQSSSNFLKFHPFFNKSPQFSKDFPQASTDSSKFCVIPMGKPRPYQTFFIQIPSFGVLKVKRLGQYTILGTNKLQQSNRTLIIQHTVTNQNKRHYFYTGWRNFDYIFCVTLYTRIFTSYVKTRIYNISV